MELEIMLSFNHRPQRKLPILIYSSFLRTGKIFLL